MQVTFTKTGERRYKVAVAGEGVVSSVMDPAPGFDARLPHDMAHFVVENTLGLMGVFGQLAGGGHARTFRPVDEPKNSRAKRRGDRISAAFRKDAELSEKVIYLAEQTWNNRDLSDVPLVEEVSTADIGRICAEFEKVSSIWSKLKVGESMSLDWRGSANRSGRQGRGAR